VFTYYLCKQLEASSLINYHDLIEDIKPFLKGHNQEPNVEGKLRYNQLFSNKKLPPLEYTTLVESVLAPNTLVLKVGLATGADNGSEWEILPSDIRHYEAEKVITTVRLSDVRAINSTAKLRDDSNEGMRIPSNV
jgi:hypothetical protein